MEDKQKRYLDKVVEFLVKGTEIDYKHQTIKFLGSEKEYFSNFLFNTYRFPTSIPSYFSKYTKDMYVLSGDEIRYVWEQYRFIIRTKILSKSINESEDKQKRYLDKVVEFLIRDTIIDYEDNAINFPFSLLSHLSHPRPPLLFLYYTTPSSFHTYCKDRYGLTDEEINYAWKEYKKEYKKVVMDEL